MTLVMNILKFISHNNAHHVAACAEGSFAIHLDSGVVVTLFHPASLKSTGDIVVLGPFADLERAQYGCNEYLTGLRAAEPAVLKPHQVFVGGVYSWVDWVDADAKRYDLQIVGRMPDGKPIGYHEDLEELVVLTDLSREGGENDYAGLYLVTPYHAARWVDTRLDMDPTNYHPDDMIDTASVNTIRGLPSAHDGINPRPLVLG